MPTYNNLPKTSKFFKGKWYQKLVEDLRLAGKAKRTVYGYVRAVRKLAEFHQKSPDENLRKRRASLSAAPDRRPGSRLGNPKRHPLGHQVLLSHHLSPEVESP